MQSTGHSWSGNYRCNFVKSYMETGAAEKEIKRKENGNENKDYWKYRESRRRK